MRAAPSEDATTTILGLHDVRRARGIPTLSVIAAETAQAALPTIFAWAERHSVSILRAEGDLASIVRRWFDGTCARTDIAATTLEFLAHRLHCSGSAARNAYRDDRSGTLRRLEMPARGHLDVVLDRGLGDITAADAWRAIARDASPLDDDVLGLLRTCSDVFAHGRVPALLVSMIDDDAEREAATLVRIAEAAPRLRVVVASSIATVRSLPAGHAADLLLEGLIVSPTASEDSLFVPEVASAVAAARAARDDLAGLPSGSSEATSVGDRARSEAERALHLALEAHPFTRGRFRLNQKIDITARDGGRRPEIDLLDAAHKLAIEVDGYYHFLDAKAYRRDRSKDLMLQLEGYVVIRTLAEDVTERLAEILQEIVRAVQDADRLRR